MKRNVIIIDESKCDGCGDCVTSCHEGALKIINGKAILINEVFCDGLGACIGDCHNNAIRIENKDALPYNETEVISRIAKLGEQAIKSHLEHLLEHGQRSLYDEASEYLIKSGYNNVFENKTDKIKFNIINNNSTQNEIALSEEQSSSDLTNWPIQLHLANPLNPDFHYSDILLASDCTSFSVRDFHSKYLRGKKLLIACPKLDSNKNIYIDKLLSLIDNSEIKSITIAVMEVPCCSGLIKLVEIASSNASREVKIKILKFSIDGQLIDTMEHENAFKVP